MKVAAWLADSWCRAHTEYEASKHTDYLPPNQLGKIARHWAQTMKRQTRVLSYSDIQIAAFGQEVKATNASCHE